MKWLASPLLWGILLILAGVVFLLQNLGIIQIAGLFWALLLTLAGLFFLFVYINDRTNWWGLIPGFVLLGVASLLYLDYFSPKLANALGGSVVLGGVGIAFLAVYLADRRNWWAIIPMGVMLTLTAVTALDQLGVVASGGIFFLGLGLTFILVALLPSPAGRMTWAWIPAAALLLMGFLLTASASNLIVYIFPLALIVGGGYLFYRALRPGNH